MKERNIKAEIKEKLHDPILSDNLARFAKQYPQARLKAYANVDDIDELRNELRDMKKQTVAHIEEVADKLNKAKANGQRIIAVGTTSTRTLEANMKKYGKFTATSENTDIFIYPGYKFEAIDCLITNFHLPKSTLLMLISAFASKELIFKAYKEAVKEKYRFFSFGDSMMIL